MKQLEEIQKINAERSDNILKCFDSEIEKGGNKTDFSTKERKNLAKKGQAMPDGSFPIRNAQDLKDAIQSIGRAKNSSKAKAWIKRRAKALGLEKILPETWEKSFTYEEAVEIIEKAINSGILSQKEIGQLEKAKYIKRTGGPGNYKYIYKEKDKKEIESKDEITSKMFGKLNIIEKYKGKHIVTKPGSKIIEVYDSKEDTLFTVALDDSKMYGNRKFVESANNVKTAKKYIDWLNSNNKNYIDPGEHMKKIEEQNKNMPKQMRDIMNK